MFFDQSCSRYGGRPFLYADDRRAVLVLEGIYLLCPAIRPHFSFQGASNDIHRKTDDNISRKSIRAIDPKYIIVGHCTGDRFYDLARAELGDEVIENPTAVRYVFAGRSGQPVSQPPVNTNRVPTLGCATISPSCSCASRASATMRLQRSK